MEIDPLYIEQSLDRQEAELSILRCLLLSMIKSYPNDRQNKIRKDFEKYALSYIENAPPNTRQELIIEVRARLAFYLQSILQ